MYLCVNSTERRAAAFQRGASANERRERVPNSSADVSVYSMWQNTRMKTHAQMGMQVDRGIWNMLGEEQVTARLGSVYNFLQPITTVCAAPLTPPKPGNARVPHTGAAKLQQQRI